MNPRLSMSFLAMEVAGTAWPGHKDGSRVSVGSAGRVALGAECLGVRPTGILVVPVAEK